MHDPFLLYSNNVLLNKTLTPATLRIEKGKITTIHNGKQLDDSLTFFDHGDKAILPGLIDAHVHINEPGRTDWEGFETATKAAAAGGITTLVDMPLNSSPVTTTVDALQIKRQATTNKLQVNCGFWGGIVPENQEHIEALLDNGVLGLKAFLTHSGIDEFPNATEADLRHAMLIAKEKSKPVLVHCELDTPHAAQEEWLKHPHSYQHYLKSRPKSWENEAIQLMIRLCEETGCATHIVHLSSAEALPMIAEARSNGLPLTVETCPHYLCFSAEEIPDRAVAYKCAPPIREAENNEQLWQALKNGLIDFVVTDHSPAPPDMKQVESGDFSKAWGGIAGLQFSFPVMWTASLKRGIPISEVVSWMSGRVAQLIGLQNRKGKIETGFDADLTIVDLNQSFTVNSEHILHRHKLTPYDGLTLKGKVHHTIIMGKTVFKQDQFTEPSGQML